ncbi:MarR family winged helix-turn-helix transcriptional regulator [Allonocardiopsis opalescens]|uniref:MarR family winged helix-turn-helix transcriptional regulator n=1 Tax=Allonocardiopsis opalescens TaxID=1144618 RepID=UPI001FE6E10D|nr:MarR family transcriptional regulator [Allonocardiopsis opalescens]
MTFWSFVDAAVTRTARQLPGTDTDATRLVLTLYRVTNMVVYDLESSVHRPRGWSWPGFRLLFVLWLAGPLEAGRAAELSGMSRQAVSALTNTLERQGLVSRAPSARDGRSVRLSLTDTGQRAIADAFAAHNERERLWAASLSAEEQATLVRLLGKLGSAAQHSEIRRR